MNACRSAEPAPFYIQRDRNLILLPRDRSPHSGCCTSSRDSRKSIKALPEMAALYCVSGARSYAQLDHALEEKNQETGLGGLAHFGYVEMMNGLLPPGFLDELRTRLSIGQVVGRKVMWDQHKSNQGKGDLWAPCPVHQEKTASFHVDDRKGYYYL